MGRVMRCWGVAPAAHHACRDEIDGGGDGRLGEVGTELQESGGHAREDGAEQDERDVVDLRDGGEVEEGRGAADEAERVVEREVHDDERRPGHF